MTSNPPGPSRSVRTSLPFYFFVAAVFTFLTIARMGQAGMFLDGTIYAAISRNLADGLGSFWFPVYLTSQPSFHEHPPLGFFLQSVWFRVLGDHLAVERAYSYCMGGLTGALIVLGWNQSIRQPRFGWLPLVFWLLPSTVTWTIVNNLLQTTEALFTTAAVSCFVLSLRASRLRLAWAGASGASILLAAVANGPTGLFPLAAPGIGVLVLRGHRAAALRSGIAVAAIVAAGVLCLWMFTDAPAAFGAYWNDVVVASAVGARGGNRWAELGRHLVGGVIMRMGTLFALLAIFGRRSRRVDAEGHEWLDWALFFLMLGIAGSVPTAVSAHVSGHYIFPALPMFALGFAALSMLLSGHLFERAVSSASAGTALTTIGVLLIVAAVAMPASGHPMERRDRSWIEEYRTLAPVLPRNSEVSTCRAAGNEYGVHAYLQRWYRISLDDRDDRLHPFFIGFKELPCPAPPGCGAVAETPRLALFRCEPRRRP
jgi:hypothetical protein